MQAGTRGLPGISVKDPWSDSRLQGALLARRVYQKQLHFEDSWERLWWKMQAGSPEDHYSFHFVNLEESDTCSEPLAYFVARLRDQKEPLAEKYKNFRRLTVMDFGFFQNHVLAYSHLIRAIMALFRESDAQVLDIVTSLSDFGSILRRFGAFPLGKGFSLMFRLPVGWNLNWNGNITDWELTHFSGDVFMF